MPIKIKIAETGKEIDDSLWVRHEVFVLEDGKFGGKPLHGHRLVDRYDAYREVYHVIAYEDHEPIAAMRLVKETGGGLPAEDLFDFAEYKKTAAEDLRGARDISALAAADPIVEPRFGSAGMLAVRNNWRRRRDVVRAMFRMAAAITRFNDVTHILVVVNHETAGMYRRLGFTQLSEKYWNEEIGNFIVPLAGTTSGFLGWALGHIPDTPLSPFQDSFTRWVFRGGEDIFQAGDAGEHAFIVESGEVKISRRKADGEALTLTRLSRGSIFGEFALIDELSRSATATAIGDCELIALDRKSFLSQLRQHPERSLQLFKIFARRIRNMDDLAMVLAFSEPMQRLEFALELARQQAAIDHRTEQESIFRGGPTELALMAAIDEPSAIRFLEAQAAKGVIRFSAHQITFMK